MSNLALAGLDLDRFLLDQLQHSGGRRMSSAIRVSGGSKKSRSCVRWAYDAAELSVAEEEGMNGGEASNLHGVLNALVSITGGFDAEHTGPARPNMPVSAFSSVLAEQNGQLDQRYQHVGRR